MVDIYNYYINADLFIKKISINIIIIKSPNLVFMSIMRVRIYIVQSKSCNSSTIFLTMSTKRISMEN